MNPVRKPCIHKILAKGYANDDEARRLFTYDEKES